MSFWPFTWQPATQSSNGDRPGATNLMTYILENWKGVTNSGIFNYRKVVGGSSLSVHSEGRALDVGNRDLARGNEIARWVHLNHQELGVQQIIWNRQIWTVNDSRGWRRYTGQNPHTDHLHIELTREAAERLGPQQLTAAGATIRDPSRYIPNFGGIGIPGIDLPGSDEINAIKDLGSFLLRVTAFVTSESGRKRILYAILGFFTLVAGFLFLAPSIVGDQAKDLVAA